MFCQEPVREGRQVAQRDDHTFGLPSAPRGEEHIERVVHLHPRWRGGQGVRRVHQNFVHSFRCKNQSSARAGDNFGDAVLGNGGVHWDVRAAALYGGEERNEHFRLFMAVDSDGAGSGSEFAMQPRS